MKRNLLWLACFAASGNALAEVDLVLRTGLEHRTNINRSADDPIDDDVFSYGGSFAVDNTERNYTAQLDYTGSRERYLDNTFPARTNMSGSGRVDLYTANRAFTWYASNRVTDNSRDLLDAEVPDNLTRVSTNQTGVIGSMRLSPRDNFDISGGKIWVKSENELSDSETDMAYVAWLHRTSSRNNVGLQLTYFMTTPKIETIDEFGTQKATAHWRREIKSGNFEMQLGLAKSDALKPDGDEVGEVPEYLLRVSTGSARSRFALGGGRELVGTGMGQPGNGNVTSGGGNEFRLMIREFGNINYSYDIVRRRFALSLSGEYANEDSQFSDDDTLIKQVGGGLSWQFRFGGRLGFTAESIFREQGRDLLARNSRENRFTLQYSQAILNNLSMRCAYELSKFENDIETTIVGCGLEYKAI